MKHIAILILEVSTAAPAAGLEVRNRSFGTRARACTHSGQNVHIRWRVQVNVGLFDKAKEAVSNVQDSLPGGVVDDAKQAASGTASEASCCVPVLVSLFPCGILSVRGCEDIPSVIVPVAVGRRRPC